MTPATALLIIGHGSKMAEANAELLALVQQIPVTKNLMHVQVAYLELAEPDIPTGIAQCVQQGARCLVIVPYFLSRGTHVQAHIPEHVERAKKKFPEIQFVLTAHVGVSPRMADLVAALVNVL